MTTELRISNMAKLLALYFNAVESKIMAYLEDFYPLDIDDSYLEYVISELTCDDNGILLLGVVKLVIE